jgi:hypothetical protein
VPYVNGRPPAQLVAVETHGSVTRVVLTILKMEYLPRPPLPLAPGGLWDPDDENRAGNMVLELHKLVEQSDSTLVFETYEHVGPLPEPGRRYIFGSWWTAMALDAVIDRHAVWVRKRYADDDDHVQCLLMWDTIAAYGPYQREGYRSEHGWITVAAYETCIEKDLLRLRGDQSRRDVQAE